jgi:MFS family permease
MLNWMMGMDEIEHIEQLDHVAAGEAAREVATETALPQEARRAGSLWRNRDFLTVLLGQGISNVGDAVTATALPLLVLSLTGSGVAMGVVGMLQTLPSFIFGLPAGAIADRWDRRRLMLTLDSGRALLTALIPLARLLHFPAMPVVYAVAFPIGALGVLFYAAYLASVPSLTGRAQIGQANSLFEALESAAWIVGPGVAGLLATWIGPGPALLIDAASFGVSALSLGLVHRPLQTARAEPPKHLLREMRDGITYILTHRVLRAAIGLWASARAVVAVLIPALAFLVTINRHLAPTALGFALSAYALGSLGGTLLAGQLERLRPGVVMLAANLVTGVALLGLAFAPSLALLLGAAATFGVAEGTMLVVYLTLRAHAAPDHLMGRVGSTAAAASVGMQSAGVLVGGVLLQAVGGVAALAAMGVALLLLTLLFAAPPVLRRAQPVEPA